MKGQQNYYKILGVDQKASDYELRKAFCKLTKELHPDTTSLDLEEARLRLENVLEAYENLHNPNLRNLYDQKLQSLLINQDKENPYISNNFPRYSITQYSAGHRRPFSNGEMFSLFLLFVVIFTCIIFAVIFANFEGKEFYSIPTWLVK